MQLFGQLIPCRGGAGWALTLAGEELGTKSKVATVNAALRRVANQRAAARMLKLPDETATDLSDEELRGAWRDGVPGPPHRACNCRVSNDGPGDLLLRAESGGSRGADPGAS